MPARYHHSLTFEASRCNGCMSCLRVCPTDAVRIRKAKAIKLQDRCIDCGECIRVCQRKAIIPLTAPLSKLAKFDHTVAIPSAALYAQFDAEIPPSALVAALRKCGFDDVEPLSPACDTVTAAIEMYLREYRGQHPLIASFCPTVVRLIQVKYPELVDQLLPLVAPREISARDAKARIHKRTGLPCDRIGAVYITPCPAKIVSILEHPGMNNSYIDAAISISDLFQTLAAAVAEESHHASIADGNAEETASGMNWAFLGGLPPSIPAENILSVAGLGNVIRILDDIEKGRLRKYSFIDCHACAEGCVAGCLTVENPYVARSKAIKRTQRLPAGPAISHELAEKRYRSGELQMCEPLTRRPLRPLDEDITRAIAKMKDRDAVLAELPGIDCGACGAPSCRSFAEDLVLGECDRIACVFLWREEIGAQVEQLIRLMRNKKPTVARHS